MERQRYRRNERSGRRHKTDDRACVMLQRAHERNKLAQDTYMDEQAKQDTKHHEKMQFAGATCCFHLNWHAKFLRPHSFIAFAQQTPTRPDPTQSSESLSYGKLNLDDHKRMKYHLLNA